MRSIRTAAAVCGRCASAQIIRGPTLIENPVLPGFNPDPSIVRVGNDYYIATSTMVWQPGIRLFHSTTSRPGPWRDTRYTG